MAEKKTGNKIIGGKEFKDGHTHVMGILNVTPDSFSDGGKYSSLDAARKRAEEMMKEGAAILDIGGESTRPGYTRISDSEEIARVIPVIEAVKKDLEIPKYNITYAFSGNDYPGSLAVPIDRSEYVENQPFTLIRLCIKDTYTLIQMAIQRYLILSADGIQFHQL